MTKDPNSRIPQEHAAPGADPNLTDPTVLEEEYVPEDDAIIGKAFRWSLAVFAVIAAAVAVTVYVIQRPAPTPPPVAAAYVPPKAVKVEGQVPGLPFTDVTEAAGIDFIHVNGAYGDKFLPESLGGGCAFLDFDNDGHQDILFVNSDYWEGHRPEDAPPATMALYRNDGHGRFSDVTAGSGLDVSFYGMGAAVGDYDGDGDTDVFISAVGPNRMFRNDGGRFTEVTAETGVAGDPGEWSTSSGFFDYDNDGDLDLFVCNYVRWSKEIDFKVDYSLVGVGRAYGPPFNYEGTHACLYRNDGDGKFTDVSADAGIRVTNPATDLPMAKALAMAPIDVDGDGWMDLLVANDTVQNFFFHNEGNGTFVEMGAESGLGFDRNGGATGAMGVDTGQFRNDDALGFFIGNFANEMTSVYVSQGMYDLFADESIAEGVGAPSRLMLTFGLFLFDCDLDGRLDLLQVNGHLEEEINLVQPSQHYEQPAQLFWNRGMQPGGCFVPVEPARVGDLGKPLVGRGAAFGDIDNDGDLDVLITQVGREPMLLRNDQQAGGNAIRFRLIGQLSNPDGIGAWIETRTGDMVQRRQVMPTRSYLSQVELPVTFGLGSASDAEVTIRWPAGHKKSLGKLKPGYTYIVDEEGGIIDRRPFVQSGAAL